MEMTWLVGGVHVLPPPEIWWLKTQSESTLSLEKRITTLRSIRMPIRNSNLLPLPLMPSPLHCHGNEPGQLTRDQNQAKKDIKRP